MKVEEQSKSGGDYTETPSLLFFDGVCNLCNRSVDFLVRRDKRRLLRYGPLQGETAARMLPKELTQSDRLPSAVLIEDGVTRHGSAAVLTALTKIGGGWALLGRIGLLVPRPIRDWAYKLIVNRRYRIWGKRDTCRVPNAQERELFLD